MHACAAAFEAFPFREMWLIRRGQARQTRELETPEFSEDRNIIGEFDPGSERTLVACLIHASRAGSAAMR